MKAKALPASSALEERTLPHNIEAEQCVLGSILAHNDAYVAIGDLKEEHFYRLAHRLIFRSLAALLDRPNGSADLVTLREHLGAGILEVGPPYLTTLIDGIPRSMNVAHYAGIVREKAMLRALVNAGNALTSGAYLAEESSGDLVVRTEKHLLDLQSGVLQSQMQSLRQSWSALQTDLEWRVAHRGELSGIDTGFQSINEQTGGWQAGDLIIIAARPSIGKTCLVINSAVAAARTKRADGTPRTVAIFSLEMRLKQLEYRVLSSLSRIPLSMLLGGHLMDSDYPRLSEAMSTMGDLDIEIDDKAGRTTHDIRAACRRLKMDRGLDLVVVDYVQLVPGTLDRRGATRNDEMTDISRRLKALADELGVPMLVLSQLSRGSEKRPDPRPKLSDLRESGALEQDADLVCFLHRKSHREGGVTNFIIEKQRQGATGTVNLTLDRDIVTFTDGGEEPPPQERVKPESKKGPPRPMS